MNTEEHLYSPHSPPTFHPSIPLVTLAITVSRSPSKLFSPVLFTSPNRHNAISLYSALEASVYSHRPNYPITFYYYSPPFLFSPLPHIQSVRR